MTPQEMLDFYQKFQGMSWADMCEEDMCEEDKPFKSTTPFKKKKKSKKKKQTIIHATNNNPFSALSH